MQTTHTKLQAIRTKIKRWRTRARRAMNALSHLEAQERYFEKKLALETTLPTSEPVAIVKVKQGRVVSVETPVPELDKFFQPEPKPIEQVSALDVPDLLKRTSVQPKEEKLPEAGDPGPKMLEDLLNPAAAINKRRLERLDAKRRGYRLPKVDKTAMPLSGREAERFLRKKK